MSRKFNKPVNKSNDFSAKIVKILSQNTTKSYNYKQLALLLDYDDTKSRNEIIKDLKVLASKKTITETEPGFYIISTVSNDYYIGTVDMTTKKSGYFICPEYGEDVYIPTTNLNRALDGDTVKVYIYNRRKGKRAEADVIEIIERNKTEFVGVIKIMENCAFVTTSNPKMYTSIYISLSKINDAKDGDVVLVKMEDWSSKSESPSGEVLKILGKPGEHNTEIHSILAEYGLPSEFPVEVEDFAQKIDTSIQESEIKNRRDMRNILTFTIDPKDAKDFDDALSFNKLPNGNYEIGIHIADVSHYLQEGTILDDEAYNRATSVYLVDRVVPMLPEVLSNFACSLRPNEEKYCFSAIFEITDKAVIKNQWFGRTVINSNQRFAYEEAQYIIENQNNIIPIEISITDDSYKVSDEIVFATLKLDQLAKIMRNNRMSDGAISFDKVEVKFNLSENGNPESVYFKIAKDANHLIEEFMLLANRKVAEYIGKQKKSFIYRIHDEPNEEKLLAMQELIKKFGYNIDFNSGSVSHILNDLMKEVQGKKEQNLIDTLAIRSMSKAIYSTDNIGHYGLAFDYYSHFTSPIRRYPDVMVHRLLQFYLDGGKSVNAELYQTKSLHCSKMEQLATKAERDSIKYMQIKYMKDRIDEEFLGVISGVTEYGIFVEIIDNKCEGMVRIRDITDDYYSFDERQYALVGERKKRILQLGDEVIVKVKTADLIKKQLDFNFIRTNN